MEAVISHSEFQEIIWDHYRVHKRSFPWRETHDPYRILVSEIMLQQTQTDRVVPKYEAFLQAFPTAQDLAKAPPAEVLRLWQGLGYNRRALNLQRAAQTVIGEYGGVFPESPLELQRLPGLGPYTAGAVAAFAFNRPVAIIETNIRRIYLHFFFPDAEEVSDKDLMPLIEETVDQKNPREWYYALMDYGSQLPKKVANPNRRSKHYTVQSKFAGSIRQARGRILALLLETGRQSRDQLGAATSLEPEKIDTALQGLLKDGLLTDTEGLYAVQ